MYVVGKYIELFNLLTGQNLPCGFIYQSKGLTAHVAKHHPEQIHLIQEIPDIIESPDYIGHNPKEPCSIELIKVTTENEMVCIKLDLNRNYLYVASVYTISTGKLNNRKKLGRICAIDKRSNS